MDKHKIEIWAAIIKAILPYTLTEEQLDALHDIEIGGLNGYDLFENACATHYKLTHNGKSLPDSLSIEEYAITI